METITFIGNGNMAFAIADGLKDNFDIEIVARDQQKSDNFEKKLGKNIKKSLLDNFDISNKNIIFCVKPANLQEVGKKLSGVANEFYSVLAGTTLEDLKQNIKSIAYIRAMPNLAASVKKSITTLVGDEVLKQKAIILFNSIGSTVWLNTQKELDIATALSGSGPAYLALIHEALCDGAVKQGMKRVDAIEVANGLFEGFGDLISTTHSAILKDGVMSPGGTTAAGYSALEKAGVRYGCISAIEEAYKITQK
jgi:pyrroline-5-carboxylate reductase